MHHFGLRGREMAAIKWIIVFDHDVTAQPPLNISCGHRSPAQQLGKDSGGFLVATAQQG